MPKSTWQTINQSPLNQVLDTRSRPANTTPGLFRYKLNLAINSSGNLCRRSGFSSFSSGSGSNSDHHRRGATREPISLLYEHNSPDGVRTLFDGTETRLAVMDNTTGEWTQIASGMGPSIWKAASLRDKILFTNNVDKPVMYTPGDPATVAIPELDLATVLITKAKLAVSFSGVMILMNLEMDDGLGAGPERVANRIAWSNYRDLSSWNPALPAPASPIAGYQDLDEGEEILNAIEFGGNIWIFTDRSIWRMFVDPAAVTPDPPFGWNRWYTEPKSRIGCLAYENALASTGKELFWLGRETIYWINQFSSAPTSPDWLLRASGSMFEGSIRLDSQYCSTPIAQSVAGNDGMSKEVWFSYPRVDVNTGLNDFSLVLSFNTDSVVSPYQTADYVNHGFTAFATFSANVSTGESCKLAATFLAASSVDYCIKQIGGVFSRGLVTLIGNDATTDIPDNSYAVVSAGYLSVLRAFCPFALPHRDKFLRLLTLDHNTNDAVAYVKLRIGNSYTIQDPNEEAGQCRVQWHEIDTLPLVCPVVDTIAKMEIDATRPDDATQWPLHEQGRFLYFELSVVSAAEVGTTGGDSAFSSLNWEVLTLN